MPSRFLSRGARTIGVRLALWYLGFFLVGTTVLCWFAYVLIASSLEARDRASMLEELNELVAEYRRGGIEGMARFLEAEEGSGVDEPFQVRVVAREGSVRFVKSRSIRQVARPVDAWPRRPSGGRDGPPVG